jgi:hypothetical protein
VILACRWLLVPVVSAAAALAAVQISLFVLFLGPFPASLAGPAAGFLLGALVVVAGSLVAPRHRVATAALLLLLGVLPVALLLALDLPSAGAGALLSLLPASRTDARAGLRVGQGQLLRQGDYPPWA